MSAVKSLWQSQEISHRRKARLERKLDRLAIFSDTPAMLTKYDGGKNADGVYQKIINNMPPHRRYFELFLGSGAIARRKRPAKETYVCDLDSRCIEAIEKAGIPNLSASAGCGVAFLRQFSGFCKDDFIYLDPPYLYKVRAAQRPIYRHEFGAVDQHMELLIAARDVSMSGAMVMISGYDSDLYRKMLPDWRQVEFKATTRSGRVATEVLWCNYERPRELHDYRFLGENFRVREKLGRRKATILGKLDRMFREDETVLYSYLAAIEEWKSQRL